jgi:predicted translin family RNA/ssDNA-binding protein
MLRVQQEETKRQEEIIRIYREIMRKTGWNMLNDQSPFTTEVDNHFKRYTEKENRQTGNSFQV